MNEKTKEGATTAFLLAQVGAHAAEQFGERLACLNLTPAVAGILGMLRRSPDISQRELSTRLGLHPSRLVAILDDLQNRGLVERQQSADDRRQNAVRLTDKGKETVFQIGRIAREHREKICASLSASEQEQLAELLGRIAAEQGLTPGVHPGYRRMKPD
jgi:DNA-binding MarR family transcriptional regulator